MDNDSGIDLFKYKMVKTMAAWKKVLFLSVKKDTGMSRKIFWLIGSKNLKAERQKERKESRKQKVSTSGEDSDSSSTDSSSPARKKKKDKRQRYYQPTLSSSSTTSDSSTDEESHNDRFKIITENEKFKYGNYPKVWQNTQSNSLKSKFQRIVWKRLNYAKTPSQIILIMSRS